jgi:hypothetical protein
LQLPPGTGDPRETLAEWWQGDVVLDGAPIFFHLADLSWPVTPSSRDLAAKTPVPSIAADPIEGVQTEPHGIVVVSQTCDIVRDWGDRPFIEISPLVLVEPEDVHKIRTMQQPRYAYVPAVADRYLVADLDQTMTIEKAVLAQLTDKRIPGCTTDAERRAFAFALGRKRQRPAFPNEFVHAVSKLAGRVKDKHDAKSPQGELARILREIRVHPQPNWYAAAVTVTFYFIVNTADDLKKIGKQHRDVISNWTALFAPTPAFTMSTDMPVSICCLSDITAEDYVNSDPLDLEYLTVG